MICTGGRAVAVTQPRGIGNDVAGGAGGADAQVSGRARIEVRREELNPRAVVYGLIHYDGIRSARMDDVHRNIRGAIGIGGPAQINAVQTCGRQIRRERGSFCTFAVLLSCA